MINRETKLHRLELMWAQLNSHMRTGDMRTTVWDIVKLAWRLYRLHTERRYLRITQIILNRVNHDATKLYYTENAPLLKLLRNDQ